MRPAVFLDRDGTLIQERHYLHRPEEVELFPQVIPALQKLSTAGFALFMVTNQSGVGRGYFTLNDVLRVHQYIDSLLHPAGIQFQEVYIAPEAPDQPSRGRKPSPQFLFDARESHQIDLTRSYMVGDKMVDVECGWNAGVKHSILVRTGYGEELARSNPPQLSKAFIASDLGAAAQFILQEHQPRA